MLIRHRELIKQTYEAIKNDQEKKERLFLEGKLANEYKVDEKDVQIVMEQAKVTRYHAVKALFNNKGDLVDTILSF